MSMKKLLVILLSFVFIFLSCQEQSITPKNDDELGNLSFGMSLVNAPSDVVGLSGVLSRSSYDTMFFNFNVVNDSAFAIVENIYPGDWKLTVNAFNNNNVVIYSGFTNVYVASGIVTSVYLRLDPVTGSLEIIVTWGSNNPSDSLLIAYYPFNGNANDASGYGNDGFVYGAQLADDRNGNPNSAYLFDGNNDWIDLGNSNTLKPQLPISVCAWIKIDGQPGNILTTNFADLSYYGVLVTVNWNTRNFCLNYGDGGSIGSQSRRSKVIPIPSIENWFHFVGVIRDSTDMDIYFNSVNAGGSYNGTGGPITYNNSSANVGRVDCNNSGSADYFNGLLDEIRIYNKALTVEEVQRIFLEN